MIFTSLIQSKSQQLGVSPDILKTIVGLGLSLLLSPLYRIINSKFIKNALSLIIGSFLLFFILESQAYFILSSLLVSYGLIHFFSKPFVVSVICSFFLLLFVHSYRFIFDYSVWKVDSSLYVMLLVTKLTYFAKWYEKQDNHLKSSLIDIFCYYLFYPGLIAGPTFSYQVYYEFINRQSNQKLNNKQILKTFQPLLIGILITIVSIYFMPTFTTTWVNSSQFFLGLAIWQKSLVLIPIGFLYRSKYFAAWYISQTSANLSGISQTAKGQFDGVITASLKFQIEPNAKLKTEYWNTSIQWWLKAVVYDSLITKMSSSSALFVTFAISAFWHGIYLTYYIGFILWAILQHLTKWTYKWCQILPKTIRSSFVSTILVWGISMLMMSQIGMLMVVLEWSQAVIFYKGLNYWPVFLLLALMVVSLIVKPPRSKSPEKQA